MSLRQRKIAWSPIADPNVNQSILADKMGYLTSLGRTNGRYNYGTTKWDAVPPMQRPRSYIASAGFPLLFDGDYYYVFGGTADNATPLADVEVYR